MPPFSFYALAIASGALLAFSFPSFGHPACGWIALAPLLMALQWGSMTRAFVLGAVAGGVYFGGTLYWLTRVMSVYGGLEQWVGVLVNIALVAYLALFPAMFAAIMRGLIRSMGARALLAVPFVWVATELGRTHLFGGFPWVLLGYSQGSVLPVAQFASVFGVYGVSALVTTVSAATASVAFTVTPSSRGMAEGAGRGEYRYFSGPQDRYRRYVPLLAVVVLVFGVAAWGSLRIRRAAMIDAGQPVRVGLIQGNVDQAEKWDESRATAIFNNYLRMSRQAIAEGAALVIWPEASMPFYFEEDAAAAELVRTLARQSKVPILLGSNQAEKSPPRLFNAAFLVQPDGTTGGVYRKMHLVPFGEYVPLKQVFFFAARLVEAVSDFSPGLEPVSLPVLGHSISTAICYEIVYPNLVRESVSQGSELLTTITNDAWFGPTSAPYQHFEQAAMRAIENGRYLVRSANTGISGIVDPYGRVLAKSHLYEPAVIVGEARFLSASTLYTRIGDLFAYASTVLTVLLLIQSGPWRQSTI